MRNGVVGCFFDATASNTGIYQSAVSLIEKTLKMRLFCLLVDIILQNFHIKSTVGVVTGQLNSPYIIPVQKRSFSINGVWSIQTIELVLKYWRATSPTSNKSTRGFFIRRPGADNRTRFMSKAIYYLPKFLSFLTPLLCVEMKKKKLNEWSSSFSYTLDIFDWDLLLLHQIRSSTFIVWKNFKKEIELWLERILNPPNLTWFILAKNFFESFFPYLIPNYKMREKVW